MASSGGAPGSGPAAGGRKWRRNRGDGKVATFRSPTAVVVWVVWLLFAVGNWIDLAAAGRDHLSVVAAAILLLVTGIAYVTAQRPSIIADPAGVTVRNPLRDHRIGWAAVTKVDLADLLRVHARGRDGQHSKVISSWAVHYSRRRQVAAEAQARRASSPRRSAFGMPSVGRGLSYGGPAASPAAGTPEADAEKIVRLLSERATAAQAGMAWAEGTADGTEVTGTEVTGTEVTGTEVTGTEVTGGAVTGGAVTGGAVTGTEVTGGAVTGGAATGGAATGVEMTGTEPLTSAWSRTAIAAVIIPLLILLVVWLG